MRSGQTPREYRSMPNATRGAAPRLRSRTDAAPRPCPARDPAPDMGAELHQFAREVEELLREWHWASTDTRVAFDRSAWDVTINGEARKSNGKGVRALIHSAFTLG